MTEAGAGCKSMSHIAPVWTLGVLQKLTALSNRAKWCIKRGFKNGKKQLAESAMHGTKTFSLTL